ELHALPRHEAPGERIDLLRLGGEHRHDLELLPRFTNVSYIWPLTLLVRSSFCECGSMVCGSPWLAQRKGFASSAPHVTASAAAMAKCSLMSTRGYLRQPSIAADAIV